jgi:hypothetical protein
MNKFYVKCHDLSKVIGVEISEQFRERLNNDISDPCHSILYILIYKYIELLQARVKETQEIHKKSQYQKLFVLFKYILIVYEMGIFSEYLVDADPYEDFKQIIQEKDLAKIEQKFNQFF